MSALMRRRVASAVILGAVLTATAIAGPAHASTSPDTRVRGQQVICGARDQELAGAGMLVRNNIYQPGVIQCVRLWPYGFTITSFARQGSGLVGSFPDITDGCDMWGSCSRGTVLPVPVWALRGLTVSVRTRFPAPRRCRGQNATDSSDIWFTGGKFDGPAGNRAELLVVIAHCGGAFPVQATVRACHRTWGLDWWTTRNSGYAWPLLRAFPLRGHLTRLHDCQLRPVIRFYQRQHLIRPSYTLMSVDWGFECWQGCAGDAVGGLWPAVSAVPVIRPLGGTP